MQLTETVAIRFASANHRESHGDHERDQQRKRPARPVPRERRRKQCDRDRQLDQRQQHHHRSEEKPWYAEVAHSAPPAARIGELSGARQQKNRSQHKPRSQKQELHDSADQPRETNA